MQQRRRKPGTPGKGPRKAITVRVPEYLGDELDRAWREQGYGSLGDYLNAFLATGHGVPIPDYAQPRPKTEPLLKAG